DSEIIPIGPYAGQVYKGRVHRHRVASATGLLSFKGLNLADKALLPRMAYLLARHSSKLHFHRPELALEFDDETVASFIKRELSLLCAVVCDFVFGFRGYGEFVGVVVPGPG